MFKGMSDNITQADHGKIGKAQTELLISCLVQTVQQLDFDGCVQLTAANLSRQAQAYELGAGKIVLRC